MSDDVEPDEAAVREQHQWNPRTGNCSCKWEPSSSKFPEHEHARHIERVLRGLPG